MGRWRIAASIALALGAVVVTQSASQPVSADPPTFSTSFTPSTIGPGSVSTLTYTITNLDPTPTVDLAFTNVLPAAVTIADPAAASDSCGGTLTAPAGGSTVTFSGGSVAASATCAVSVDVTAATPGVRTNPAVTLTSDKGSSMSASTDLTVDSDLPGFSKSFSPSTVELGDRSTLTFTVDNSLNAGARTLLTFTDDLPAGMVVADPADVTDTCDATTTGVVTAAPGSDQVSYAQGSVAAAATCTITLDVRATGAGALDNVSGELTSSNGFSTLGSGKASDRLTVDVDDVHVTKQFVDDPTPPGGVATIEFTITNYDRADSATAVAFTDDLPAPLAVATPANVSDDCGGTVTATSGTDSVSLSGGTIAAGATCTITVEVDVPIGTTPGTYVNTTSAVTADVGGSPVVGNVASDTLFVLAEPIFTKEFIDDPAVAGGTTTLRFTITNTDPTGPVTGLAFTDDIGGSDSTSGRTGTIPFMAANGLVAGSGLEPDPLVDPCGAGSELTIPDPNDTLPSPPFPALPPDPTLLTFSGGTLAAAGSPGDSCTFDVVLDIPDGVAGGSYLNTTSELTGSPEGAPPATDPLVIVDSPILVKEFTDDPVTPGDPVTLEFTITNPAESGPDATSISFTDDLSGVLSGLEATSVDSDDCGASVVVSDPTQIVVTDGSLAPLESCTIVVTLSTDAGSPPGTYTNTTTDLQASVGGTTVTSPAAADDLVITELRFDKEFVGDPAIPGETITLRFEIENLSPTETATGVSFGDDLAAVLPGTPDLTAGTASLTDCGAASLTGTTTLSFTGGEIAPATTCVVEVPVTVPGGTDDGSYRNATGTLTATVGGTPVSAPGAVDLLEVQEVRLELTKAFSADPVVAGDSVDLTFTITNLDTTRAVTGADFTDSLGAAVPGMTFDSVGTDTCTATINGETTTLFSVDDIALAAAASCTIEISVTVPGATPPATYVNTTSGLFGSIAGLSVTGAPATDSLTVVDTDVTFSKSFDGPVIPGGTATLTFTLANGGSAVSGLGFTDDLDATLSGLVATGTPVTDPCGSGSSVTGTSLLTFSGGSLAATTGICTFQVDVLVPAAATPGAYPNTTSSLTSSGLPVQDPATADLTVIPAADISVAKSDGVTEATPGESVVYTIVVANDGPSTDPSVSLTDTFPTGLTCTSTSVAAGGAGGNSASSTGDLAETLSMPTGSSVTYTSTCAIDPSATGGLSNTATATASVTETDPSNDSASDNDTVLVPEADIQVVKIDTPDPVNAGSSAFGYVIQVTNDGPSDAPSVSVADTFPAEVTCTTTSAATGGATGNTAAGSGDIADTLAMPAGSVVTYTASCSVDPDVADGTIISNTATATSTIDDPNSANDSDTQETTVGRAVDVSVTKTDGVTIAVPGESVTYTIVVANAGPSTDSATSVTDSFPAGLSCTTTSVAAGGATGNTPSGSGDLADTLALPPGSSVTYTAVCDVDPGATGTLSNTVTVSSTAPDLDTGNDSASDTDTVLTPEADVSVTKTDGVTSATPGGTVTYTIVAANAGPSDDPSVTLTDAFPTDLACSTTSAATGGATGNTPSTTGDLAETLAMPAGSTVTYTATCDIDPGATGVLSNTATVGGSVTDPDAGNDSATDADTALSPGVALSVTKTDGVTTAVPGQDTLTYVITVINAGPSDDPSVTLTDGFPAGLTCTWTSAASGGATGNTPSGTGDLAETLAMPAGSSVAYTATCDIADDATGTVSNTATATPSATDPDPSDNTATDDTELAPEADLSVTKTDGITAAVPGRDSTTYTIVVENAGPSVDPAASLTDALPDGLTCTWSSTATGGATGNSASGSGDLDETISMPVGSSATYTVSCDIDASATGTLANTATATSSVTDPDPGDDTATDETSLTPEADLSVTKTDGTTSAVAGRDRLAYRIVVENAGPSDDPAVSVVDRLPAPLTCTWTSTATGGATGSSANTSGDLDETISMPVGSSVTYVSDCEIDRTAAGPLSNTVTVTGSANDPSVANDAATDADTSVIVVTGLPATGSGVERFLLAALTLLLAGLALLGLRTTRRLRAG